MGKPTLLDELYNERGLSVDRIANEIFDHQVCTETVRRRLHAHDLMDREPTLAEQLADPDVGPEDIGFEKTADNSHARFSKRGGSA